MYLLKIRIVLKIGCSSALHSQIHFAGYFWCLITLLPSESVNRNVFHFYSSLLHTVEVSQSTTLPATCVSTIGSYCGTSLETSFFLFTNGQCLGFLGNFPFVFGYK